MPKRVVKKTERQGFAAQQALPTEAIAESPQEVIQEPVEATTRENKAEFTHDPDAGTVEFCLTDGTPVVMKEPKARDFLLMEAWLRQAPPDYRDLSFLMIRLALACVVKYGDGETPSMDDILDSDDWDDIDRLVSGLQFFRLAVEKYFSRLSKSAAEVGL